MIREGLTQEHEWRIAAEKETMLQEERIVHLKQNFLEVFEENIQLKKENEELKSRLDSILNRN